MRKARTRKRQKVLDGINGRELRYRSAVAYSYFLYVNALCRQDEHYTEYVRDSIQFYEEGQYHEPMGTGLYADEAGMQGKNSTSLRYSDRRKRSMTGI